MVYCFPKKAILWAVHLSIGGSLVYLKIFIDLRKLRGVGTESAKNNVKFVFLMRSTELNVTLTRTMEFNQFD